MSIIDEMLQANEQYATNFTEPVRVPTKLAVVTCKDARIDPWQALGLEYGQAHVIRNGGGRVLDAIRSLVISQLMLGTEAVAIIHHTECGMMTFSEEELWEKVREQGAVADHISFLPFTDLEQSVRDDLAIYRKSPLVRQDIEVRGFIYDVHTGRLSEVQAHPSLAERTRLQRERARGEADA